MKARRTATQSLLRLVGAAMAVLLLGLVINQFATGEGWSTFDFLVAEVLIAGAVLVYEVAMHYRGTWVVAVLSAGLAATGGAGVIVGEVDDAPGLILIGLALILTAIGIGVRSLRRAALPENEPEA